MKHRLYSRAALAGAILLAGGAAHGRAAPAATTPVVKTTGGAVKGVPTSTGWAYRGVPYAAPPVGPLRWKSPQAPRPWSGIRQTDTFGAPCAQAPLRGITQVSDTSREDCLFLNVWTPAASAGARLPVMVWIHGGGFVNGMGSSPTYNGERFAAKGVILITINYRLGAFGFLARPDLTAQSAHRSSGNYGLEDQVAALKWISTNVAAFGGDPGNVTIFGQSAGGASVLDLMASPLTKGLFRRAIVQSGAARTTIAPATRRTAERAGLGFGDGKALSELRALDTRAILQMSDDFLRTGGRLGPVIDGYVLTQAPLAALAARKRPAVDLLIGSNAREGLGTPGADKLDAAIRLAFGVNTDLASRLYGLRSDGSTAPDPILGTAAQQFATDSTFRCGAVEAARTSAAAGARTWQYQFEQLVPGREQLGAAHSFEVPYVFGTLSPTGFAAANYGDGDRALAALMNSYWANFARTGDPNGAGLPRWPAYTVAGKAFARLSSALPKNFEQSSDLRGELCGLFPASTSSKGE